MTCIVGITDGRTVTVGGDSAGSDGWHVAVGSGYLVALEAAAELTEGVRPPFTVVQSD